MGVHTMHLLSHYAGRRIHTKENTAAGRRTSLAQEKPEMMIGWDGGGKGAPEGGRWVESVWGSAQQATGAG